MVTVKLAKGDTVISQDRLDMLLAKERAHDAYLWATKRMADKVRNRQQTHSTPGGQLHTAGYEMALLDFAQLVVDAPQT